MIPLVYIAGPFGAPTFWRVRENIRAAENFGLVVAKAGAYPVIPHANTGSFFGLLDEKTLWLPGTMELMRRCDGVVFLPTWIHSKGATAERVEAIRLGLPVYGGAGNADPTPYLAHEPDDDLIAWVARLREHSSSRVAIGWDLKA